VAAKGEDAARQPIAMARYYAAKGMQTVELSVRKVLAGSGEGDTLRMQLAIVKRLAKYEVADTIAMGRQIARAVISVGRYTL